MSFSDNLKKTRKEKGLSQEDLAELLMVSRQAVSKWEMGDGKGDRNNPNSPPAGLFARFLSHPPRHTAVWHRRLS